MGRKMGSVSWKLGNSPSCVYLSYSRAWGKVKGTSVSSKPMFLKVFVQLFLLTSEKWLEVLGGTVWKTIPETVAKWEPDT